MSFEKLLGELDELQKLNKSAPADDETNGEGVGEGDGDDAGIAAAAADGEAAGADVDAGAGDDAGADADEGAAGHAEPDGDEGAGAGAGDGDGDETMGKSFRFTLENGEEVEAVDGTEMVKSLIARFDAFGADAVQKEESMTKALGVAVDLIKSQGDLIKSQGEAIGSLQNEVKRLASEGRGRKTVVSVAEKPAAGTMAKSEPAGVSGDEFMAKCLAAQAAGRITGLDVAKAEGFLLKGLAVPADIVKRVLV